MLLKAIVVRKFGGPGVLHYESFSDPEPAPGEVRIAVRAIGTNPVDAGNRADGTWAGIELPWIPGYEVAGMVERIGSGVDGLEEGDRVVGMTNFFSQGGGYAELANASASEVAKLSTSTSFVSAAATPLAGGTAWELLNRLTLRRGSCLLVLGGSGGVGSYLLQLAAMNGITVVATGRAEHHDRMRSLGAAECIDYDASQDPRIVLGQAGGSVDAIADLVGRGTIRPWLRVLKNRGQIASIATPEIDLNHLLDENLTFHGILIDHNGTRTRILIDLLNAGRLVSHVSHLLPLSQAGEAHRILESRHAGGKVVLVTEGTDIPLQ